ncbi:hypothetical protein [Paraburkholderia strydomiana]
MSTIIRFLHQHTGQPATENDRLSGDAHWVECDHLGVPIRNSNGQCNAFASPDTLSAREQVDMWRETDPQVQMQQASTEDDTAAIRAYLAAKYGDQVAAPEGAATPHL